MGMRPPKSARQMEAGLAFMRSASRPSRLPANHGPAGGGEPENDGARGQRGPLGAIRAALHIHQPPEIVARGFDIHLVVLLRPLSHIERNLGGGAVRAAVEFAGRKGIAGGDVAPHSQHVRDLASGAVIEPQIGLVGSGPVQNLAVDFRSTALLKLPSLILSITYTPRLAETPALSCLAESWTGMRSAAPPPTRFRYHDIARTNRS